MDRNLYLDEIPLDEAKSRFFGRLRELGLFKPAPGEVIPVNIDAIGRITSEPVFAAISSPHYHASAMDGVAVKSESTFDANERHHIELKVGKDAIWVDTGDPLPEGCDAVIMVEDLLHIDDDKVTIAAPARPWENVRVVGEDIVATELILPENHILRPQDIGAMLAGGVTRVAVRKRPRVAIIPTGDELVGLKEGLGPGGPPPGEIIEFNSQIIGGLVKEWGGESIICDIVPDDRGKIASAVKEAAGTADIVVVNAGSSAGSQDYSSVVIRQLGEVLVHGVAIRPGKPVILGIAQGKPALGIPGYPVSCALACELFLKPLIFGMLGRREFSLPTIKARMAQKLRSPGGVLEFVRVKVGVVGDRVVAVPIARGAGLVSSLVRADGVVRVPSARQGIEEGEEVTVELIRPEEEIRDTIVHVGSHDIALDLLATYLGRLFPGTSFLSAHAGSIGGLLCLRRREAHVAGV
ncbi:MAG TPA: molybdopterin biosynthesis protein, partial [Firmicutes bacterium]|nr:molybdopterin biosynthesis protein [Bacillota bacterium]